jgi:hypothetical protein
MDWANESVADAIKFAYKDGQLDAFRGKTVREFHDAHLRLDLVPFEPDDYVTNALPVAESRVALAGFRLADFCFSSDRSGSQPVVETQARDVLKEPGIVKLNEHRGCGNRHADG